MISRVRAEPDEDLTAFLAEIDIVPDTTKYTSPIKEVEDEEQIYPAVSVPNLLESADLGSTLNAREVMDMYGLKKVVDNNGDVWIRQKMNSEKIDYGVHIIDAPNRKEEIPFSHVIDDTNSKDYKKKMGHKIHEILYIPNRGTTLNPNSYRVKQNGKNENDEHEHENKLSLYKEELNKLDMNMPLDNRRSQNGSEEPIVATRGHEMFSGDLSSSNIIMGEMNIQDKDVCYSVHRNHSRGHGYIKELRKLEVEELMKHQLDKNNKRQEDRTLADIRRHMSPRERVTFDLSIIRDRRALLEEISEHQILSQSNVNPSAVIVSPFISNKNSKTSPSSISSPRNDLSTFSAAHDPSPIKLQEASNARLQRHKRLQYDPELNTFGNIKLKSNHRFNRFDNQRVGVALARRKRMERLQKAKENAMGRTGRAADSWLKMKRAEEDRRAREDRRLDQLAYFEAKQRLAKMEEMKNKIEVASRLDAIPSGKLFSFNNLTPRPPVEPSVSVTSNSNRIERGRRRGMGRGSGNGRGRGRGRGKSRDRGRLRDRVKARAMSQNRSENVGYNEGNKIVNSHYVNNEDPVKGLISNAYIEGMIVSPGIKKSVVPTKPKIKQNLASKSTIQGVNGGMSLKFSRKLVKACNNDENELGEYENESYENYEEDQQLLYTLVDEGDKRKDDKCVPSCVIEKNSSNTRVEEQEHPAGLGMLADYLANVEVDKTEVDETELGNESDIFVGCSDLPNENIIQPAFDCERHRRCVSMLAGLFASTAVVDVCLSNEMRRTSLFLGLSSQFKPTRPSERAFISEGL